MTNTYLFDIPTGYAMMQLAVAASYDKNPAMRAICLPAGAKEIDYINGAFDASALLAEWDGKLVLTPKATEFEESEIASVWSNMKVNPVFANGITCFQGYYDQWSTLEAIIKQKGYKPDLLGAHSMGASTSILMGFLSPWYSGQPIWAMSPTKVVTADSWTNHHLNLTRFLNFRDFAVAWPWLQGMFQQNDGFWYFDDLGTVQFKTGHVDPVFADSITDHFPSIYLAKFETLMNNAHLTP